MSTEAESDCVAWVLQIKDSEARPGTALTCFGLWALCRRNSASSSRARAAFSIESPSGHSKSSLCVSLCVLY